jgi:FKBP-type peptidyl-prolyl cis-trans isomerase FkpA
MRKIIACFLLIALLAGSCIKNKSDCPAVTQTAPSREQQELTDYITSQSISAFKHSSGLYYSIEKLGSGEFPAICASIEVTFYGYLTNGSQFESGEDKVLNLQHLLPGWRLGLPLIKTGGKIRLYLPPSLAYGYNGKKDEDGDLIVPENSVVIYDITLHNFY